jgi:hypothetical protein
MLLLVDQESGTKSRKPPGIRKKLHYPTDVVERYSRAPFSHDATEVL